MAEHSTIEWTDATWNPVRGCTKISPGCKHCYAEVFAERFRGVPGHPYEQGFDLRLVPEKLAEPLRWASRMRASGSFQIRPRRTCRSISTVIARPQEASRAHALRSPRWRARFPLCRPCWNSTAGVSRHPWH